MSRICLRQIVLGIAAGLILALAGCSGGGGGSDGGSPPATGITISGVVTAPAGQVAKLQNKNILLAVVEQLFPSAEAAINGVSVVPNTTVTAVRVDGSGNVLATLGTATTDARGHYVLTLPSGTVLSPTLIIRVQGGATTLRAPVVQALVDITPASEWLMQQLKTEGVTLDNLKNDDLLYLQAVLESYTVNAGGDIAATLANLATLQSLIAGEIAAVKANIANPPSFNGTWVMSGNTIMVGNVSSVDTNGLWISGQWLNTVSDYTATLTQKSGYTYGLTLNGYESETSQYAHGSSCTLSATPPHVSGCAFQSYNWAGDGNFYQARSFGPVAGNQQIFALADGRVVIPYAAQLTIEQGDIFGYVTPPYAEVLMPMGGDTNGVDGYAGVASWPTFAYALTVDGKSADYTQLRGGSGDIKPMALIKQSSGLTNSVLNGRYAYIAFNHDIFSDGDRLHSVFTGTLGADGAGAVGTGTITGAELARIVNNTNSAALTGNALSANITGGTYAVTGAGGFRLDLVTDATNQPPTLTGHVNGTGNFFYARAVETQIATSPQEVIQTSLFGIKVSTAVPTLSGKTFRFRATDLAYGPGSYSRYGLLAYSTLAFVDGTNASLTINSQAIDRSDDVTSIVSHPATMGQALAGTYTTGANGAFTLTLADGTIINGYVNAASLLAVYEKGLPASGSADVSSSTSSLGIAMGRCVTGC